jgi:hypothetical protein
MNKKTKPIVAVAIVAVLVIAALFCWKLFSPEAQAGNKTVR